MVSDFETQLNEFLERSKNIKSPINAAPLGTDINEYNMPSEVWMNDVQIFYENYLKDYALGDRIKSLLFHRKYNELVSCLTSISKDSKFIDKMNGIQEVAVPKYQAKGIPQYDVFISHANRDKENFVEAPIAEENQENNNDRILKLHNEGMSYVDIAKELGLGVGEVKLVINLFKGAV